MRVTFQLELGTVGFIGVCSEDFGILCGIRHNPKNAARSRINTACGERSSAGRASVCGTEGRGFKSRRSPQNSCPCCNLGLVTRCVLASCSQNWEQLRNRNRRPMVEMTNDVKG
jgi:hypothetical protein